MPEPGDWIVVYQDGYVSWSPAKAFEAYRLLRTRPQDVAWWPDRLREMTLTLTSRQQFVAIDCGDGEAGVWWWQVAWQPEAGELDVSKLVMARFTGDSAEAEVGAFLEHRFAHLLKAPAAAEGLTETRMTIDALAERCAGDVALGALVQAVEYSAQPTKIGQPNGTVVHTVTFRTVMPPGHQVDAGATVGEVKMTVGWRPDDPALDWMRLTQGQHYLATVRPVDGAKLQAVLEGLSAKPAEAAAAN